MRKIYEFTVNRKEEVEKTETIKDEKTGEEIKQTKKVEKDVAHTLFFKRPSRSEYDESELFRAAAESDCVSRGIISGALLVKRLLNDGGILTENQKSDYEKLRKEFEDLHPKYDKLAQVDEEKRSAKQKKELSELMDKLSDIMQTMNQLENASSTLFNRTAEAIARNKTILWLSLHLAYENKNGKDVLFFGEGDYKKKLAEYDVMEEREDKYEYEVIQKFMLLIGQWYTGKAALKEDFDLIIRSLEDNLLAGI